MHTYVTSQLAWDLHQERRAAAARPRFASQHGRRRTPRPRSLRRWIPGIKLARPLGRRLTARQA